MFSKSCNYALRAVLYLAIYSDDENKLGVEIMSQELAVPKEYLAKILQHLSKRGIISSSRGRSGGFYMNNIEKKASLQHVIKEMGDWHIMEECVLGLPSCSEQRPCPMHHNVADYRQKLNDNFTQVSVEDMAYKIITNKLRI